MNNIFGELISREGDLHIFDYTKSTNNSRKVELHETDLGKIRGLAIHNPNKIKFISINLEHPSNSGLFVCPRKNKRLRSCEAICVSSANPDNEEGKRPWLLFTELKYCKNKNARKFQIDACSQIWRTYKCLFLFTELEAKKYNIYFVISFPNHESLPFKNALLTQSYIAKAKRKFGVILKVYHNNIEVVDDFTIK